MFDLIRIENLERVDRADFEFATQTSNLENQLSLPGNVLQDPTGQRQHIVAGFGVDNPSAPSGQVRVTRGVALLGFRENGVIKYGATTVAGEATRIVDVSGYSDGTYGVYIRFQYQDAEFQNRVFWNPTTAEEYSKNIATRREANWGLRVQSASPGADWYLVGDVTVTSNVVSAISHKRDFFFEGDEDGATAFDSTWGGGANDRDTDRAAYGAQSLAEWIQFVNKKIEEIQTGTNPALTTTRRWDEPSTGSLDDMLPLSGSTVAARRMRGAILPATADTYTLGDGSLPWAQVFCAGLEVDTILRRDSGSAVGSHASPFGDGFFTDLDIAGSLIFDVASDVQGDFLPWTATGQQLGDDATNVRWDAFLRELNVEQSGAGNFWNFRRTGVGAGEHYIRLRTAAGTSEWIDIGFDNANGDVFVNAGANSDLQFRSDDNVVLEFQATAGDSSGLDEWVCYTDFIPDPGGSGLSLGRSGQLWDAVYATDVFASSFEGNDLVLNQASASSTARTDWLDGANIIKGWVRFNPDGAGGVTINDGFNVTSVVTNPDEAVITWATAFTDTDYLVLAMLDDNNATTTPMAILVDAKTVTTTTLVFRDREGADYDVDGLDIAQVNVLVVGRQ